MSNNVKVSCLRDGKKFWHFWLNTGRTRKLYLNHNDCWFSLHVSQLPKKTLWLLLNALVMIMKGCMTYFMCPKFMRWSVTSEWSFRIAGYVDELHDWSLASITVEWLNFGDGFDLPNAETKMERFATIEQLSFLGYWLCDRLSSKPRSQCFRPARRTNCWSLRTSRVSLAFSCSTDMASSTIGTSSKNLCDHVFEQATLRIIWCE